MLLVNFIKETIAAVATPAGRGGVGVVRISGPLTKNIAQKILGFEPKVRYAHYADFTDPLGDIIDQGIGLFFQTPHSFTGEDVFELQGHGGPIVLDRLLNCVISHGARLARPGEFSEQAFLNQKLDLTQAEAIADLINAESEQAARCAVRSLQGEFSAKIQGIVDQLVHLRMYVEAAIDFPEEEIDFLSKSHVLHDANQLLQTLVLLLQNAQQGVLISEGVSVVIAGAPNVGKSSLLNYLSGQESAIVTDVAGTTRDILREKIILDGLPLHIIDTAGLRDTHDIVEKEGIRRAKLAIEQADVVLYLLDISQQDNIIHALSLLAEHIPQNIPHLAVINKIDLKKLQECVEQVDQHCCIYISVKERRGLEMLKNKIKEVVGYKISSESNFIARRRHIDALQQAKIYLEKGIEQLDQYRAPELFAEDLRLAQEALNSITGKFTSDDLLGEIFSNFCIGK